MNEQDVLALKAAHESKNSRDNTSLIDNISWIDNTALIIQAGLREFFQRNSPRVCSSA